MRLKFVWERTQQVLAVLLFLAVVSVAVYEAGMVDEPVPGASEAFWDEHDFVGMTAAEVIAVAGEPMEGYPNNDAYCLDHGPDASCVDELAPPCPIVRGLHYSVVTDVGGAMLLTLELSDDGVVMHRQANVLESKSR